MCSSDLLHRLTNLCGLFFTYTVFVRLIGDVILLLKYSFIEEIYKLLYYIILWKMKNMGKKLYKRLQSHRLNPLKYDIYPFHRSLVCLVYEMSSFNLICLFVVANNIQLKSALVKIGAQ